MQKFIKPSTISGTIECPPSKSYMQRAVAIAYLSDCKTIIQNPSFCNDSLSALKIIEDLGCSIIFDKILNEIEIVPKVNPQKSEINCGESGLCLRMFTPIVALLSQPIKIFGDKSLVRRPLDFMINPLKILNAEIQGKSLPVIVKGPLKGNNKLILSGNISSQFITGLLIALPHINGKSILQVNNLRSKKYVDMTVDILHKSSIKIINKNHEKYEINGNQKYHLKKYFIEGDWSSAAFWICAAIIGGEIILEKLNKNSIQPDKEILNIIEKVGGEYFFKDNKLFVKKKSLKQFTFNAQDCPDLFPILSVLGAFCNGESKIFGVDRLQYKESNRGRVIVEEFSKIGINIRIENNFMIVKKSRIIGGIIDSNNDHRIAMAATIAGLFSEKGVLITGAESVRKSYPDFWKHLKKIQVQNT